MREEVYRKRLKFIPMKYERSVREMRKNIMSQRLMKFEWNMDDCLLKFCDKYERLQTINQQFLHANRQNERIQ